MTGDYKMCGKFHIDGSGSDVDYGVETSLKGVYWNSSLYQLVFTRLYTRDDVNDLLDLREEEPASLSRSTEPVKVAGNPLMAICELLEKTSLITVNGNRIRIADVRRLVFDVPSDATSWSHNYIYDSLCVGLMVEDIRFTPTFMIPADSSANQLFAYNQNLNNITIGKDFFPIDISKAPSANYYLAAEFDGAFFLGMPPKDFTITISDGTVDDAYKLAYAFFDYETNYLGIFSMEKPTTNVLHMMVEEQMWDQRRDRLVVEEQMHAGSEHVCSSAPPTVAMLRLFSTFAVERARVGRVRARLGSIGVRMIL